MDISVDDAFHSLPERLDSVHGHRYPQEELPIPQESSLQGCEKLATVYIIKEL